MLDVYTQRAAAAAVLPSQLHFSRNYGGQLPVSAHPPRKELDV
jgi:hypothetical protein